MAENYPETLIHFSRGTEFTQQGAQPGAHPSYTAIAIPHMLKKNLKKHIKYTKQD